METEKILALLLRGLLVYLYLMLVIRVSGKRIMGPGKQTGGGMQHSAGTILDLMVAFIISDMPDDMIYGSVPLAQGFVAMGTIALLHLLLSYANYRSPALSRLLESTPALVLQDGKLVLGSMARERFSEDELDSALREKEVDNRRDVDEAYIEPSGALSVQLRQEAKPLQKSDLSAREKKQ